MSERKCYDSNKVWREIVTAARTIGDAIQYGDEHTLGKRHMAEVLLVQVGHLGRRCERFIELDNRINGWRK